MKIRPLKKKIKAVIAGIGLLGAGLLILSWGIAIFDLQAPLGLQAASANSQYGIIGRQAPELELNTWIDGNGKPMDPVKLRDYRGKVIYLYFFQDW